MNLITLPTPDWECGITMSSYVDGIILKSGLQLTNKYRDYIVADESLKLSVDSDAIKNYLKFSGVIYSNDYSKPVPAPASALTRKKFKATGNDTYNLPKCNNIQYVARYLSSKITEVINTTTFKIKDTSFDQISRYFSRMLLNNLGGSLVANIKTASGNHIRPFSVSGDNIVLTSPISDLSQNNTLELINSYNVLPEGLETTTGYPNKGYVITHIEGDNCYVKFPKYDVPPNRRDEYVIVYYNQLSDYSPELVFDENIRRIGLRYSEETLDFPITQEQFDSLLPFYLKYLQDMVVYELVTYRPNPAQQGWKILIDLPYLPSGELTIIDVSGEWVHPFGQLPGMAFYKQTVKLANYVDNLASYLKRMNQVSKLGQIKLAQNKIQTSFVSLRVKFDSEAPNYVAPPIISGYEFQADNTITINWEEYPGVIEYTIQLATDNNFENILRSGSVNKENHLTAIGNDIAENSTFYVRLKVTTELGTSEFSEVLEIIKITYEERIIYSSNKSGQWQIWSMKPDGTNHINITNDNSKEDHYATYSLALDAYIFSRKIGSYYQICKKDRKTATVTQLTSYSANCINPSISPDGSKIAFIKDSNNITIINSNTGTELYSYSKSIHSLTYPRITNDNKIIYSYYTYPTYHLKKCDLDGSNEIVILNKFGILFPSLSGDGSKVMFRDPPYYTAYPPFPKDEVSIINIDGSGFTTITNDTTKDKEFPCFSPDSTQFLFVSPAYNGNIYKGSFASPATHTNLTNTAHSYELNDSWKVTRAD